MVLFEIERSAKKNYELELELRECIIWCLNVYIELVSPNTNKSFSGDVDLRKHETDVISLININILGYL